MSGVCATAKERPALFAGSLVQALLDGRKTMTRRICKIQPDDILPRAIHGMPGTDTVLIPKLVQTNQGISTQWTWKTTRLNKRAANFTDVEWGSESPYGGPGDRLWVRETWRVGAWGDGEIAVDYKHGPPGRFVTVDDEEVWERLTNDSIRDAERAGLKADDSGFYKWDVGKGPCRWRPSIHMYRWASRISLKITDVRVERIQDITPNDIVAEGVGFHDIPPQEVIDRNSEDLRKCFRQLWGGLYGPDSWDSNQWVWVYRFERV